MPQGVYFVTGSEENLTEINRVYAELLQVTGDFLQQAETAVPSPEAMACFGEQRAALLKRLQPLVDRQQEWLPYCDRTTLAPSVVAAIDKQFEQMRQLEELGVRLMECLAGCQSDLGKQLGQVRSGKKALSGYGRGPKAPPRFCRGTV